MIELGPLEAGHTYMLEKRAARSILAIEANTRAYLKCLIVKEVLHLTRARFLLGNFVEYLRGSNERYDLCLASGVLYHMTNPVELIHLISKTSDKVLLWTHYFDQETMRSNSHLSKKLPETIASEYRGFAHSLHRYEYLEALNWSGFCGGSAPHSFWMSKTEILACLRYFGFHDLRIEFDTLAHPNGPAFCVLGIK
ncbi:MAG: class I SAM-dependent methyltransferase [Pyrinomonadaceae bacterium]